MYNETYELFYFYKDLSDNIETNLTLQNILTNFHWINNGNDQYELLKYLNDYVSNLNKEETIQTVLLIWLLCAIGLIIILFIIIYIMFKKRKQKETVKNYYEMENENYYGST
eukprot:119113_1